jgi:hypothetical protein
VSEVSEGDDGLCMIVTLHGPSLPVRDVSIWYSFVFLSQNVILWDEQIRERLLCIVLSTRKGRRRKMRRDKKKKQNFASS